ncbi:MAG: M50 family metallopeptidase [Clostridia bacterium]|nr:M50 family metallopeptidase [Clostridia bacterium]
MWYIYGFIFLLIIFTGLLQHILHECGHMLAAILLGEKIAKVEWLKYHGGTRVFYENEPEYNQDTAKKWVVIASGGYIATNTTGYFLVFLYNILPYDILKLVCYIAAMMFLITDSLYFTLGSIGNFGDIAGIRDMLHMPKSVSMLLSILFFAVNILILKAAFYR